MSEHTVKAHLRLMSDSELADLAQEGDEKCDHSNDGDRLLIRLIHDEITRRLKGIL